MRTDCGLGNVLYVNVMGRRVIDCYHLLDDLSDAEITLSTYEKKKKRKEADVLVAALAA